MLFLFSPYLRFCAHIRENTIVAIYAHGRASRPWSIRHNAELSRRRLYQPQALMTLFGLIGRIEGRCDLIVSVRRRRILDVRGGLVIVVRNRGLPMR
jgi:hypothetical protein